MLPKANILHSIVGGACPRCHTGKMYVNPNPYVITETMKMHEHCSHCGFQYKIEPNFFFGAMYVSYGLSCAVAIGIFLAAYYGFKTDLKVAFASIFIGLITLMPLITRLARNLYINMFVGYQPDVKTVSK